MGLPTSSIVDLTIRSKLVYDVRDYGAVCDGSVDDSTAVLAALAAANATGGDVSFPQGRCRIRQTLTLVGSTFETLKPVSLVGCGEYATTLVWDPAIGDIGEDCVVIHQPLDSYVGGGVRNLSIVSAGASTGAGIHNTDGYRNIIENVGLQGFTGAGGTGLKVSSTPISNQHLHVLNVHCQGNDVGMDITGVQEMTAVKLCLNQNTTAQGIIRSGTIAWFGGLVQGGDASLEFSPISENCIAFRQYGVYWEVTGSVNGIKANPAVEGFHYAGKIKIVDATNNGSYVFADIDSYNFILDNMATTINPGLLKARNAAITIINCSTDAARYDLDAITLSRATFSNEGCTTYGMLPSEPDVAPISAKFGSPIRVANFTQTERDALTDQEEGCFGANTTSKVPNIYIAGEWRSVVEPDPIDIAPSLMHHFDGRKGIGVNTWSDMVGSLKFTGVNSPVHAADGKHFKGQPVWQFLEAGPQSMDTGAGGPVIFPVGTGAFYIRMVFRRTAIPAGLAGYLDMFDNAEAHVTAQFLDSPSDGAWEGVIVASRINFSPPPVQDLLPHRLELWLTPTLQVLALDGVPQNSSAGVGVVTAFPIERLSIGAYSPTGALPSNVNIADLKIFPGVLTADQLAALDELDSSVWGTP